MQRLFSRHIKLLAPLLLLFLPITATAAEKVSVTSKAPITMTVKKQQSLSIQGTTILKAKSALILSARNQSVKGFTTTLTCKPPVRRGGKSRCEVKLTITKAVPLGRYTLNLIDARRQVLATGQFEVKVDPAVAKAAAKKKADLAAKQKAAAKKQPNLPGGLNLKSHGNEQNIHAPTGLTAVTVTSSQVSLIWVLNSENHDRVILQRHTTGLLQDQLTLSNYATTYLDSGLISGTTYYYRIKLENDYGGSTYSNEIAVTPSSSPDAPGSGGSCNILVGESPTNGQATATSSTSIQLTWQDQATSEDQYKVEFRTGFRFNLANTVPANSTSFHHTGLEPDTRYVYRVCAVCNPPAGQSCSEFEGRTSQATTTTTTTTTTIPITNTLPPFVNPPEIDSATAIFPTSVRVRWRDKSENESGFSVLHRTGGGVWSGSITGQNLEQYLKTGLLPNTVYFFQVCAIGGLPGACSTELSQITFPNVVKAPTNLVAEAIGPSEIHLSWQNPNGAAEGDVTITLSRRKTNTPREVIFTDTSGLSLLEHSDTGLAWGTSYIYRVCASNSGSSDCGTEVSAVTVDPLPKAPNNVEATANSHDSIELQWQDMSLMEDGFRIKRLVNGQYVMAGQAPGNATSYTDTGLNAETRYHYQVCAYNNFGERCGTASGLTPLPPPQSPPGSVKGNPHKGNVLISWDDNAAGETGYKVERRFKTVLWTTVGTTRANQTQHTDREVLGGRTYQYRVCALFPNPQCSPSISVPVPSK